jgi:hypothetical protein
MDLEQKQREDARWRILRILDAGRPIGVNEDLITRVLNEVELPITIQGVRRELTYLRDLGLIKIEGEESMTWSAKLTAGGVDLVEYTAIAPPGIARPKKYW